MDRNNFIENYIIAFLAARMAYLYPNILERMVDNPPVNDARTLAEAAWDSLEKSVTRSLPVTNGNAEVATTATASTPITSNTPDTVDPTL